MGYAHQNHSVLKTEVCIIGAGIQGCATALELAKRGVDVLVVERDYPGRGSSGVNAGGVRRLNRHPSEIPLALASHEIWSQIKEHVGTDCGYVQSAQLNVAETEIDLKKIRKRVRSMRKMGYEHEEILTPEELGKRIPLMSRDIAGALFCDGDGFASPFLTTQAFARKAQDHGAKFILGHAVNTIERVNGHWNLSTRDTNISARIVVNCAGAWGNAIAEKLGDPAPVQSEAPMMLITPRVPHFLDDVVGLVGRRLSFKQRTNGTLLIGGGYRGTVSADGNSSNINAQRLGDNAAAVLRVFPHLKDVKIARAWSGVEGMTPDHLPIISPSQNTENLFHAFGFSSHGFQLGPIVGRIVANLVMELDAGLPIEPFHISRFENLVKADAQSFAQKRA